MRVDRVTLARIAAIVLVGVLVQITTISQISVFGSRADLSPLIVASIGLLAGPEIGAMTGFAVGLFVDTALLQTMGVSALIFLAIGYMAGRYGQRNDVGATLVPPVAGALATVATALGYSLIQFLLGVDSPVSVLLLREIAVLVILNTIISVPVFIGIRRVLRPALPQEIIPRRPRRRLGRVRTNT